MSHKHSCITDTKRSTVSLPYGTSRVDIESSRLMANVTILRNIQLLARYCAGGQTISPGQHFTSYFMKSLYCAKAPSTELS